MRIKADFRGLEELDRDLKLMRKRAIPHAIRDGLNNTAFEARKTWQDEIHRTFTTRNRFTENSVRVEKARGIDIRNMQAVVGSVAPYMHDAEFGVTESKKGKHGSPIPTSVASGEGRGTSRKRPVRRPNQHRNIDLKPTRRGSRHQRNAGAIQNAKAKGFKHVFLDLGRRKGIFRLSGGKRRTKLDMIWDLSHSTVRIKPHPTLQPTVKTVEGFAPGIHRRALIKQFQRANLPWK